MNRQDIWVVKCRGCAGLLDKAAYAFLIIGYITAETGSFPLALMPIAFVATLGDTWLEVSLIPETLERTNLGDAAPGDPLNVEVDVLAKYVERLLPPFAGKENA